MLARILVAAAVVTVLALIATGADQALAHRLQFVDPAIRRAAALLTRGGDATPYLLVTAGVALFYRFLRRDERRWRAAAFAFAGLALSGILVNLLKIALGRVRPGGPFEIGIGSFLGPTLANYARSFPSGHATTLGAVAALTAVLAPRWLVPAMVLATCIGISRLLVGYHFLGDVIAGFLLGWASVELTRRAFARHGWWPAHDRGRPGRGPASR
ncbi:MAG: phosphatase PAP2 family protein [Alphaproteobacteria bacterium]|nr:phosphatase PAP2 family protein [Alphaproteobacteria bacterium]